MTEINSRRNFFKGALNLVGLGVAANSGVYIVGSIFKSLDGNLTAGAKTWQYATSCSNITYNSCSACSIGGGNCIEAGAECDLNPSPIPMFCQLEGGGSAAECLRCQ